MTKESISKPYKATQTVTVKDVPRAYADMFNSLLKTMMSQGNKSRVEAFQEMISRDAINYLGMEEAERAIRQREDAESLRMKAALDKIEGPD